MSTICLLTALSRLLCITILNYAWSDIVSDQASVWSDMCTLYQLTSDTPAFSWRVSKEARKTDIESVSQMGAQSWRRQHNLIIVNRACMYIQSADTVS